MDNPAPALLVNISFLSGLLAKKAKNTSAKADLQ